MKVISQTIYGGWESATDRQGFGNLGYYVNRSVQKKMGSYLNVMGGFLYYNYLENNLKFDVTSPSFSLYPGLSYSLSKLSMELGLGAEYRHEKTTYKNSIKTSRNVLAFSSQFSLGIRPSQRNKENLLLSFNTGNHYIWSRFRIQTLLNSNAQKQFWPGLEVIAQGNRKYSAAQAGIVAEFLKILKGNSLVVKAGYKRSFAKGGLDPNSAYAGLELSFPF